MHCGIGFSILRNTRLAGEEAMAKALQQLGAATPKIIILHATIGYDQVVLLDACKAVLPGVPIVGCSAEGVICGIHPDESPFSVSVLLISDATRDFFTGFVPGLDPNPKECGSRLINDVLAASGSSTPSALLIFPDGVSLNATQFLAGIDAALGVRKIPIFGGAAGDDWSLEKSFQYANGKVNEGGVSWVAIVGGEAPVCAMSHGCHPLSVEARITKCAGNKIMEVDGISVIDFLDQHVARSGLDWRNQIVNIAIAYKSTATSSLIDYGDEWKITHVVSSEESRKKGYILVQPEFQVGAVIQLARRDPQVIREGLRLLATQFKALIGERTPELILHYDCAGRGKVVFPEMERQMNLQIVQDAVAKDTVWSGFFTYGEIMPVGGVNAIHNYTAVLVAFL